MFEVRVDDKARVVYVDVSGYFTEREGIAFTNAFINSTRGLDARSYVLVLDGRDLKVTPSNLMGMLQGCVDLYIRMGFSKIYLLRMKSSITMLQMTELVGLLDNVEIVDAYDRDLELA